MSLPISSPLHIQKSAPPRRVMLDVVIALLPATIAGIVIFGIKALFTVLVCVASAVLAEYIFNLCVHKKQTIGDFSAVVTGLLLSLNLGAAVPLWQCAIGAVFATVVVKCLFGGLGKNIVNPAATAHVFMLLCFSAAGAVATPTVTQITAGAAGEAPSLLELFLGLHAGAIGATCAPALLIGFVYLVARRVIKWYVPASFVATVFACCFLFGGFDALFALQHVLTGAVLLGGVFMVTDSVTTPITNRGRVVFCVGAGLLTFAVRHFGTYAEGVSIAILTMNLVTPFINDLTKKKRREV